MKFYFFLGILQGIFEWLPISSEGVVALTSQIFKINFSPIDCALFLHLGTLFAVLIYFRRDFQRIITLKDPKLTKFLLITTLVSLAVGFPLYKAVKEVGLGRNLLFLTGFGLFLTAYFQRKQKKLEISENKLAFLVGFLQGLAVIPGLSRSGATIFGLSLKQRKPSQILKISYLISAPPVGAMVGYFLITRNPSLISWPALITSFLMGVLSLNFLIKLSAKINFFKFALIFGILCFLGALITFL